MLEKLKNISKKTILRIIASILMLILLSLLIEYFGFGRHFIQYRFLFILAIVSLISLFLTLRKKIGQNPELGFLAVALICGSLLSISALKEYISWDEKIHYQRVEKISLRIIGGFSRPGSIDSSYSLDEQKKINEDEFVEFIQRRA